MSEPVDIDRVLIADLGSDAILYAKRVFAEMSPAGKAHLSGAMDNGMPIEVRVRMRGSDAPTFGLYLIGKTGELELHSTASGAG